MCPIYWLNAAYSVLQEKPSFISIRSHVLRNDPRLQFDSIIKQHEASAAENNTESDAQEGERPSQQQRLSLDTTASGLTPKTYITEALLRIEFEGKVRI